MQHDLAGPLPIPEATTNKKPILQLTTGGKKGEFLIPTHLFDFSRPG